MTNGSAQPKRSLNDQNRWKIWLIISANTSFLYSVIQANEIKLNGITGIFTNAENIVSAAFAFLITTVISGLLDADTKERIVFLRWNNVLPGHRAFSLYGPRDSRVDAGVISKKFGPIPSDPKDQNKLWYKIFRSVDRMPHIEQLHRDFLLLRDYTAIATLCVFVYGMAAYVLIVSDKVFWLYIFIALLQPIVVRQSAFHHGVRLVTNTLAEASKDRERTGAEDWTN